MADQFKFPDEKEVETKNGADKDDLEIEIVDDTPERDRGAPALEKEVEDPTDAELESYSDKVRTRIQKLTHARHDERRVKESALREKQELERLAHTLINENKQLKGYVENGVSHISKSNVTSAEAELAKARQELKSATEAFDTDKIVQAQEDLAAARWKLENAKNFRPAPLQTVSDQVQLPQSAPEKVQPDEKSLRWQAKNQWFGGNGFEDVTSYALGLHQKLVNSGVDPRSDEYYEKVDSSVRNKFPEVFGQTKSEPTKRAASVVAPATRSSGVRKVQLTQTQVALAKKFGLTPQQYAAQVAKLEN